MHRGFHDRRLKQSNISKDWKKGNIRQGRIDGW